MGTPPANMKTTSFSPAAKKVNWSRLPDRLTEGEVEFSITAWTANARTIAALERQAKRDGYKSVFEYLNVTITSMLLSDESQGRSVVSHEPETIPRPSAVTATAFSGECRSSRATDVNEGYFYFSTYSNRRVRRNSRTFSMFSDDQ